METLLLALRLFTLVTVITWFVIYWRFGLRLFGDIRVSLQRPHTRLDGMRIGAIAFFSWIIWMTGLFICLGRLEFPQNSLTAILAGVGVALTLLGIGGMFYTRRQLGRLWAAATRLQPDHRVVDHGPYRLLRHPIYSFAVLMNLGFFLVFPTWWDAIATVFIFIGYALKARDEERFLLHALQGYAEYLRRVPYRLIPWIW